MTTYVIPGTATIELVTDRAKLVDLDVPMDVPAVVVVRSGRCKHVLDIKLMQAIVAEFSAAPKLTQAPAPRPAQSF
mgnify:FL=1